MISPQIIWSLIAGNDLCLHLSQLLSCITLHGAAPDDLLKCTTIPIPKGHNPNLSYSDNYRGITLSSVFGRVLDLIILFRYEGYLISTCDLQFGFKHRRSTSMPMCTMMLKEVISYYINNDSSLYCVFLDATKAFDKVEYCALFRDLLKRNIPPIIIRILLNIYTGQHACRSVSCRMACARIVSQYLTEWSKVLLWALYFFVFTMTICY